MAIEFVGAVTTSTSGSLSLTSLTGGLASAPAEDDIVIVVLSGNATSDVDISVSGYTEIADLYANASIIDTQLGVYYKIMGGSPDTSVTIPSLTGLRCVVQVWRGIDTTTPQDTTRTTATKTNSSVPDPPSITTISNDALVVIASGAGAPGPYTEPSGYSNVSKVGGSSSNALVASKIKATPGSENPGVWSGADDESFLSCASVTMAFRPAGVGGTGGIKVWNGSAWVSKPVKVWNGSAWVTKPVKRWNGSSWVTTPY
jgi:hypothetical protein